MEGNANAWADQTGQGRQGRGQSRSSVHQSRAPTEIFQRPSDSAKPPARFTLHLQAEAFDNGRQEEQEDG